MADPSGQDRSSEQLRKQALLRCALVENWDHLLAALRIRLLILIRKGHLKSPPALEALVRDIAADVFEIALRKAQQYDVSRPTLPWLIGFAKKIIKGRMRDERRLRDRRRDVNRFSITPISDLRAHKSVLCCEVDLFDRLCHHDEQEQLDAKIELRQLLRYCREDHRDLLCLFYVHGFDVQALAEKRGKSRGAIKTALCRARNHLRTVAALDKVKN